MHDCVVSALAVVAKVLRCYLLHVCEGEKEGGGVVFSVSNPRRSATEIYAGQLLAGHPIESLGVRFRVEF